jgi:hypothetical protein
LPRGLDAQAGTDTANLGTEVSMGMLAERVDHVIGVDTHRDSHSAAVCNSSGAVTARATVAADALGYKCLPRFAREGAPGWRVFAIERTGSYGAGLTSFLLEQGEWGSRSIGRRDRPGATGRNRTSWTPRAPPARRSPANTSPSRVNAANAKRSASSS